MVSTGFIRFRIWEKWWALANTVTYVRDVQNAGNLTGCGTISFPRRTVVHGVKSHGRKLVGNKTISKFNVQSYS